MRSLEKENCSKAIVDEQPKSLDYSEHDSLVSTVTATSTESKRSENALKPNALERRYHLLYLRAFEIQCMFEGLLEKRNFLLQNREFQKNLTDTSDEEPIAKVAKFKGSNFTSHKDVNLKSELHLCDADFEDSEGEKEMECLALSADCVDHPIIVPVTKSKSPPKSSPPVKEKTPSSVVKRQKDFSKFNRSNRKSKNCAIFYYKHIDTDNDQIKAEEGKESEPTISSSEEEEIWEYSNADEVDKEIIASTIENVKDIKSEIVEHAQLSPQQIASNGSNSVKVKNFLSLLFFLIILKCSKKMRASDKIR